jgi:hypothetical protein
LAPTTQDPDADIRLAAFARLRALVLSSGGALPWSLIAKGVNARGQRFLFASAAEGIFRPVGMSPILSLKTVLPINSPLPSTPQYFACLSGAMDNNVRDAISAIIVELDYAACEIVQEADDWDVFYALPVIAIGSGLPTPTIALRTTHAEAAAIVDAVLERDPPDHGIVVKRCETASGLPTIAVTLPAHLYERVAADRFYADISGLGSRILHVISRACL